MSATKIECPGNRRVEIRPLDANHESRMGVEVLIVHPERETGVRGVQAPEVHRYPDERTARSAAYGFARALGASVPSDPAPSSGSGSVKYDDSALLERIAALESIVDDLTGGGKKKK